MIFPKIVSTFILTSSLFLQACSVGIALNGKKDPDLTVIKKDTDREEVEFQLGSPKEVLSQGADTIAIYEYELGNEASAGRAVAHGAMDILTLGIWEVIGTPVELSTGSKFEIQITYDQHNKIKSLKRRTLTSSHES